MHCCQTMTRKRGLGGGGERVRERGVGGGTKEASCVFDTTLQGTLRKHTCTS